jgi:DNA polymerase-3 subunit epsilon
MRIRKIMRENEALDVDIMHRKLMTPMINNFLDQLFTAYNIPLSERNSAAEDAYKLRYFLKLKSRLGIK